LDVDDQLGQVELAYAVEEFERGDRLGCALDKPECAVNDELEQGSNLKGPE
jgi:hypothetical protein